MRHAIIVDEAATVLTAQWAVTCAEARNRKIALICAHQSRAQFVGDEGEALRQAIMDNSSCHIYYRVGHDDACDLAPGLFKAKGHMVCRTERHVVDTASRGATSSESRTAQSSESQAFTRSESLTVAVGESEGASRGQSESLSWSQSESTGWSRSTGRTRAAGPSHQKLDHFDRIAKVPSENHGDTCHA